MGLYLKQNENRSELQQRLDAELRAKAAARSKQESELPDGVEDSSFIKDTKQTTSLAWVWLVIFLAIVVLLGIFIYMTINV